MTKHMICDLNSAYIYQLFYCNWFNYAVRQGFHETLFKYQLFFVHCLPTRMCLYSIDNIYKIQQSHLPFTNILTEYT